MLSWSICWESALRNKLLNLLSVAIVHQLYQLCIMITIKCPRIPRHALTIAEFNMLFAKLILNGKGEPCNYRASLDMLMYEMTGKRY